MSANLKNSAVATELENVSFLSNPKEAIPKNVSTITLILHANTIMLKILQTRLHQYLNWEFPYLNLGLEKAEELEIKLLTSVGSSKKAREFQKNIYFCFFDYAKAFDCVDHNKLENSERVWEYQTTWPAFWETCMQVRKQQLELDMEQQTGSK